MRITAELIDKSTSFLNPCKERELDLRGNKIPAIENLAITRDQYDAIDLTDNDIRKLDNFPTMKRLSSLYVSNNPITKISDEVGDKLPNLKMLILQNTAIDEVEQLKSLSSLPHLTHLSLIDSPVTRKPQYRLRIISLIPQLRVLDFQKITQKERQNSQSNKRALVGEDDLTAGSVGKKALSEGERERIKTAIANAKSLEEIKQLERILSTGHIPNQ